MRTALLICALSINFLFVDAQSFIDLSGTWQFQLDPDKKGNREEWFRKMPFNDRVQLPGTTDTNQKGRKTHPWPSDSVTRQFEFPKDFEHPDWIYELNTAPSRRYKYIGAAWYQKEIEVPDDWQGKRMELFLERSLFKMIVWIDGRKVGEDVSLYAPRRFDISNFVKAGGKHVITLCIDNTNLIGGMAHGYTYHTQTNWNGVVGKMEIRKHDQIYIESLRIFTDIYDKNVRLELKLSNHLKNCPNADFTLSVQNKNGDVIAKQKYLRPSVRGAQVQEFFLPIKTDIVLWDEFTPELYTLNVTMQDPTDATFHDEKSELFGFRNIKTDGTTIRVNDRPTFIRGTLDCAIYPKTAYMPMDRDSWQKILSTIKSYGMNHVRYHSVCPPRAAFEVADELGIYIQAEMIWGPEPSPENYALRYLYNDGFRILKAYGNHPSFTFMALGNELSTADTPYKNRVINAYRGFDSRRLYSTQAGHVNKKHSSSDVRYNKTWENGESCNIPREQLILNNDFDFSDGKSEDEPPLIIHENGQWVMYPGFDFMQKYDGVIQPDNFYPLYRRLKENGLENQDKQMAVASGKHGVWHTKQVFESLFRTEGVAGFQYLGLQDFPGQSEAMIGILDPFWDSKGYISPEHFRQFCCEVVPLLRFKKWVYTNDDIFEAEAGISNYGPCSLNDGIVSWRVLSEKSKLIKKGQFKHVVSAQGEISNIGKIKIPLNGCSQAGQYRVQLAIDGTSYKNEWDFYVYPVGKEVKSKSEVYISHCFDKRTQHILKEGGKVLLLWPAADYGKNVQKISYTPQYWSFNRGTLGRAYPGTAGLLCDPRHPLFNDFPTQAHADARWMDLIDGANAFVLNDFKTLTPVVQMIDDYHRNNKLAAIFETTVGKGKLLACAFDIEHRLDERPVAQLLRKSIMDYMGGEQFRPKYNMETDLLTKLLPASRSINRIVEGSGRWPLHDYRDVLDGDPNTFWSSEWNGEWRARHSHYLVIELGCEKVLSGLAYTPRQDSENGRVADYEVYVSKDGKDWGDAVAKGHFNNSTDVQKVIFNKLFEAKFIKFISLKEVNNRKWAAIADLEFF